MIDYVKILLVDIDVSSLLHRLNFITEVSEETGEILKQTIQLHYCTIRIRNDRVEFYGSIHKFYNSIKGIQPPNKTDAGYNGNLLTIVNVFEIKNYLTKLFDCKASQMIFLNIEFGINTIVDFSPGLFIKNLLYHKGKSFEYKFNQNYAQSLHQRFIIKVYDKSLQYGINENVLRFEVKVRKTEELKKIDVVSFDDISIETLEKAKNMLLERLNEIVYYDCTVSKKQLTKSQKECLNRYSNPRYWISDLEPNHRHRHKQKLNSFITQFSDNLKQKVKEQIEEKCVIINQYLKSEKCVTINHLNIGLNTIQIQEEISVNNFHKRKCAVTGLSLELEKGEKIIFIRTKTLRYLQKHKPYIFELLVSDLLSKSFKRPKREKTLIPHLAKQIRNRFYNKSRIKKVKYFKIKDSNQLSLFD